MDEDTKGRGKEMDKQTIRIVRKNDEYSAEYQVGDIFTVDSTWYGGANVTSKSGIPISLDREEYETVEEEPSRRIDPYSYGVGVMDCFCEMVASGLKTLAMSHPCDTKEERDEFLPEVKKLCGQYGILYYPEDEAFITPLFPAEMNRGKYNYLFFRTDETLNRYLELKERQKDWRAQGVYTTERALELAREFGRLLSYPQDGIERLIGKAGE